MGTHKKNTKYPRINTTNHTKDNDVIKLHSQHYKYTNTIYNQTTQKQHTKTSYHPNTSHTYTSQNHNTTPHTTDTTHHRQCYLNQTPNQTSQKTKTHIKKTRNI